MDEAAVSPVACTFVLTLSLAFRSAPQWMRCSAQSHCPVLTATCRGVLCSWGRGGGEEEEFMFMHEETLKIKCHENTKVEYFMKVSGRVLLTPLDGAKVIFKIKNRLQLLWPRVTLPRKSSTNLVSGGELGSSIQEELQGRQAASPAGPVDRCGLQLKTQHVLEQFCVCVEETSLIKGVKEKVWHI